MLRISRATYEKHRNDGERRPFFASAFHHLPTAEGYSRALLARLGEIVGAKVVTVEGDELFKPHYAVVVRRFQQVGR